MPGLSNTEKASWLRALLDTAQSEQVIPPCTFYLHGGSTHFVMLARASTGSEDSLIEDLVCKTELNYEANHPDPPAHHIVLGENLIASTEVIESVRAFLRWVLESADVEDGDDHALVLPGAVVTAQFGDDNPGDGVMSYIYFPPRTYLWTEADLRKQAQFAMKVINGIGRTMHVVINGCMVADVIPGASSSEVIKEYRKQADAEDEPVIPEMMADMLRALEARARSLRDWLTNPRSQLFPPEVEVLDANRGIFGYQSQNEDEEERDGLVLLFGDQDEIPANMIERVLDADLLDD